MIDKEDVHKYIYNGILLGHKNDKCHLKQCGWT